MADPEDRSNDWVIALFAVSLALLLTPALQVWAAPETPWAVPYAVWGLLILLAWAVQRGNRRGD